MGFLSSTEVHERSSTDLIAGYVGQTALKTVEALNEALGAVLFIDEAYRLGEGNFATEAVNTLVDSLTKPKYMGKMLVVLAGYEGNMNDLLKVNPGLSSRFPEEIIFQNMRPENAFQLLKQRLRKDGIEVEENQDLSRITATFAALSALPFWGNGRDVETLAKSIARATFLSDDFLLTLPELEKHLTMFLQERVARSTTTTSTLPLRPQLPAANMTASPPPMSISTQTETATEEAHEPDQPPPPAEAPADHPRDPGVSDTIWTQLQHDIAAAQT